MTADDKKKLQDIIAFFLKMAKEHEDLAQLSYALDPDRIKHADIAGAYRACSIAIQNEFPGLEQGIESKVRKLFTMESKSSILKNMKKWTIIGFLLLNTAVLGKIFSVHGYFEWWQLVFVPLMVLAVMLILYFGFKSGLPEVEEENAKLENS